MKTHLSLAIILALSFSSCDFPEHYFTTAPECISDTKLDLENQQQLITILQDKTPSDYRYFFKTFIEDGSKTYMITNFRNDKSCFDIKLVVEQWDRLAGMKRTNGKSYPKELYDLKWTIGSIDDLLTIKYVDMHKIID